jgi:hypothetical protein
MTGRELIDWEFARLSEPDLERALALLRALAEERIEAAAPALAAESTLAKDWLSAEEDAARTALPPPQSRRTRMR